MNLKVLQIGSHIGNTKTDPIFKSLDDSDNALFVEPIPWLFEQLVENYNERYLNNSFIFMNNFVDKNAKKWAGTVQDLMREHSPDNNCLAIDVSDPVGIQMLLKQFNVKLVNAQKYIELARSIKSDDELICMKAAIEVAEIGITTPGNNTAFLRGRIGILFGKISFKIASSSSDVISGINSDSSSTGPKLLLKSKKLLIILRI